MNIEQQVLRGCKRSIAKIITMVEEQSSEATGILSNIYEHTGKAKIIGITGPPGSGKSSIVNQLTRLLRSKNKKVGIIAVDPTSPFTGGALLGDRVRMQELTLDEGVFIRSMGSRGALGGLSRASYDAAKVMDAAGMDYVLIETVGVGQSEVDIVKLADIVVLVLIPGMGDDIQAIKAGIMEIGDIFVVNKADRDGAAMLVKEIEMMFDLNLEKTKHRPPVIKTIATSGEGIQDLEHRLNDVWNYLVTSDILYQRRKNRVRSELFNLLNDKFLKMLKNTYSDKIEELIDNIINKKQDPYSSAESIFKEISL
ncbi:MAG: methylmalonyl Co-A mutase-associated GTPase MeaB [Thermoanaerobacterales bacterium]|jgi:LAO/AO transport system kinase|nr:methylmalonyl Co-A mutase-associated GTPase MeaB [Thermoanaerobacterales bacterium]